MFVFVDWVYVCVDVLVVIFDCVCVDVVWIICDVVLDEFGVGLFIDLEMCV